MIYVINSVSVYAANNNSAISQTCDVEQTLRSVSDARHENVSFTRCCVQRRGNVVAHYMQNARKLCN